MAHPWMTMELSSGAVISSEARAKLSKYVSIRKDKSQRFNKDKNNKDDDDGADEIWAKCMIGIRLIFKAYKKII